MAEKQNKKKVIRGESRPRRETKADDGPETWREKKKIKKKKTRASTETKKEEEG